MMKRAKKEREEEPNTLRIRETKPNNILQFYYQIVIIHYKYPVQTKIL